MARTIKDIEFEAGYILVTFDSGPRVRYPISSVLRAEDIPDLGAAHIEGVFTTWTIQAIYNTETVIDVGDTLAVRNNGNVLWYDADASARLLRIISSAGAVLATISARLLIDDVKRQSSLLDMYFLIRKYTGTFCDTLLVQEGLTELWERLVDDDSGAYTLDTSPLATPGQVAISPSGEWIAALCKDSAYQGLIFIYKGS